MSGTKVECSRDVRLRGNRMAIDGEWIDRAAKRAAGRAGRWSTQPRICDRQGARDGGFDGPSEMMLDQAGRVSRLAKDIESCKDDVEAR
jgi:hypothetical protein